MLKTSTPSPRGPGLASRLLTGCAIAGLLASANAQEAPADTGAAAADDSLAEETVVVTGTRVRAPGLTAPQPVTSIGGDALRYSGQTNIIEVLDKLPALVGSIDQFQSTQFFTGANGTEGLNLLNLRNLGVTRTLVLVNGRRHVGSSTGNTAVDINTIPTALIERVDILTGGASSVYGADAVTGVVNFIMKRDFEGQQFEAEYGISGRGDADTYRLSATAGTSFDGGRGHFMGSVEFRQQYSLSPSSRKFAAADTAYFSVRNPAELAEEGDDANIPDRIYARNVRWPDSAASSVVFGIDGLFGDLSGAYLGAGVPFDLGTPAGNRNIGGNATRVGEYNTELLPEQDVLAFNAIGDYEFSPKARLFVEAKYVQNRSESHGQPTFDFALPVRSSNAFLPQVIRDNVAAVSADDMNFFLDRDPSAPNAVTEDYYFANRDNFDIGFRGERAELDTYRFVVGLDGQLTDALGYEASFTYGKTDVLSVSVNNRITDRWIAATDAYEMPDGQIVCRSSVFPNQPLPDVFSGGDQPLGLSFTPGANSGCVPINIFQDGPVSQEALDWIFDQTPTNGSLTQQVFNAFLTYDTTAWLELPGGGAQLVVGGEWRREESRDFPDPIFLTGNTFGNVANPTTGNYEVAEGFAELLLPVLADMPFARELTFNASGRYSHYSTAGDTFSWSVNGVWAPVEDLRLRASYAKAVRAPNVGELFTPEQQSFFQPDDPCDRDLRGQGTAFRGANCDAALTALGITDPDDFVGLLSSTFPGIARGNEDLRQETADTFTVGVVLQPSFIQGFSATVDYWNVEIKDGILFPDDQDIVNACYDAPTLDNPFCDLISRVTADEATPSTPLGQLDGLTTQSVNIAAFKSSGVDFEVQYRFDVAEMTGAETDQGSLRFSVLGSWLDVLKLQTTVGGAFDDEVGEALTLLGSNAPEWVVTLGIEYANGPWTINYGYNYQSSLLSVEKLSLENDPDQIDRPRIGAKHEHDVSVRYEVNEMFAIYGGVTNLFDQQPDIGQYFSPSGPVGRAFFLGVTARFGSEDDA
jgi:outer membrane receptor protein involved in Fe transport